MKPIGLRQTNRSIAKADRTKYWFFIHCLRPDKGETTSSLHSRESDLTYAEKLRRVEAVLFVSREAVSNRKLAKLAGLADATEARTLIRQLNLHYDQDGRAFRIDEVAGGVTLLTRSHFAPWLRRLRHVPGETKLSQSAMETLAVVAYRQPVLRADVEAIRGVGCSEVLKQLMESDLVRICGRSEDLGRPYLYGTTKRFLQIFGLRSPERLPRAEWVNAPLTDSMSNTSDTSFENNSSASSEAKEFTVKMSLATPKLPTELSEDQLEQLNRNRFVHAVDEDDDDMDEMEDDEDDYDDDEEDDFEDEDEEFDDEDDDEADVEEGELEDDDEEEFDDLDEEDDGDWEEVDDEEDEDWDDEEDDDWDDDEEEEDEDEEEWD